jgi:hypothetical protein
VATRNCPSWPGESNSEFAYVSIRGVTTPNTRQNNAVSTIADEIWQYRTGGNLTIFGKHHDTAEADRRQKQGSCSQAYGFATITMYSWWQLSEIGCASEFEISQRQNFKFGTRRREIREIFKGV